ncbi:MAG: hypothetical protein ACTSU5_09450 [Promethearchaeota archaeon]
MRAEQELVFGLFGVEFSPKQDVYLLFIPRLHNILVEFCCLYISEKIYQQVFVNKISHFFRSGERDDSNSSVDQRELKFVRSYLVLPFPVVFLYVWVTLDLFTVIFDLLALYCFFDDDYTGLGIMLAFSFLTKFYAILYLSLFFFYLLKKKDFNKLVKMTAFFFLVVVGLYFFFNFFTGTALEVRELIQRLFATKNSTIFNFPYLNGTMDLFFVFPYIVVVVGSLGIFFVLFSSMKGKNLGIPSFVMVFCIFMLSFIGFAAWWLDIIAFYFPFLLQSRDEKIRKETQIAILFFIAYIIDLAVVVIVTAHFFPDVEENVLLRIWTLGEWPHYVWLVSTYSALVIGTVILLRVGWSFHTGKRFLFPVS